MPTTTAAKGRPVLRPFAVPLRKGQITEETSFTGKYTEPAIQLLEYEGGGQGIRFCYYSLDRRFQRSPMMIDSEDSLEGLRAALSSTPKLRAMIKKLAS
jgi:hypothetical protein